MKLMKYSELDVDARIQSVMYFFHPFFGGKGSDLAANVVVRCLPVKSRTVYSRDVQQENNDRLI